MLKARVRFHTSLPLFSSRTPLHTAAPQLDKAVFQTFCRLGHMQDALLLPRTLHFFKQTLGDDFHSGGPGKLSPQKVLDQSQAAAFSPKVAKLGSGSHAERRRW